MICKSCKNEMHPEYEERELVMGGPSNDYLTGKYWCKNQDCKRCGLVFAEAG